MDNERAWLSDGCCPAAEVLNARAAVPAWDLLIVGGSEIEFGVLGPLTVHRDGVAVDPGAPVLRRLLAVLLCRPGRPVSAPELCDAVWDGAPPRSARKSLQGHVHRLRQALGGERRLAYGPAGYSVLVEPLELDALRFAALAEQGRSARRANQLDQASACFQEALSLWRGEAFADIPGGVIVGDEARRLAEERLLVCEERAVVDLDLGRHGRLVGELTALVEGNPYRENLRAHLMLALYRSGRQVDALEVFRRARTVLVDELGVEPGAGLQRLHEAMLRTDERLAHATVENLQRPEPASIASAAPEPVVVVPRELPGDVHGFTGRTEQLRALTAMVPDERAGPAPMVVSTIAGMAGVGKTALALHWAHQVADRFPDGQLYLNLRGYASGLPVQPVDALAAMLRSLGIAAQQVPPEEEEAAALYRSVLAGRRVLVVLDNARTAEQVRPLLPGASGCLVLVTSRDRLGGLVARNGARRLDLGVLAPAEAHTLVVRILGAQRVRAEPQAADDLTKACAYLPLALRIAAANLADRPRRSMAAHVAELEGNRLTAFTVDGDESVAVRAAFDLSYHAIPPDARRLFRLLALVPGADFTAAATTALTDTTGDVARLLTRLAAANLIDEIAPDRFAFHDLLRRYAREQVEIEDGEDQRDAATGRLFAWYLHTVDAAAPLLYPQMLRLPFDRMGAPSGATTFADAGEALRWLDAERHNLVAAVRHASQHGPRPMAWLLADRLRGYFARRRHVVDWLAAAQAGLSAAEREGERRGQAAAHISLAQANHGLHRHPQAIHHLSQALSLGQDGSWPEAQVTALGNLAIVYAETGQLARAADSLGRCLALNRHLKSPTHAAVALTNLGGLNTLRGRLGEAIEQSTESIALYETIGVLSGMATPVNTLGEAYRELGRLDEALSHHTRAAALSREFGDRYGEATALACLALAYADTGRLTQALDCAEQALDQAREIGDRHVEARARIATAVVRNGLADHDAAARDFDQALATARAIRARHPETVALIGLATARSRLGHHQQALEDAHTALDLANTSEFRVLEGQALTLIAEIHLAQRDHAAAVEHARRALDIHQETGHQPGETRTREILNEARAARELRRDRHRHHRGQSATAPDPATRSSPH